MRDAVICLPLRTPVGRFGGALSALSVEELAAHIVRAIIERSGIDPERVDDCIFGQGYPGGEAPALGRIAALNAGLGIGVPGFQVDRRCGSGLQAILIGAMEVQTGVADLVIAGGAESMSNVEHYTTALRFGKRQGSITLEDRLDRSRITAGGVFHPIEGGMIETAENLRRTYGITRRDQDLLAQESHRRAAQAQQDGRFSEEIVEVPVPTKRDPEARLGVDEHVRADVSIEDLERLTPLLRRSDPDATVTAGNASGQNDAAAACLVTTPNLAEALGLEPLVRLVTWATAGIAPERMGLGPVPAANKVLARAGLSFADMDLIEINEAFAAQVLACLGEWGLGDDDRARINVSGSGISLGHPIGATGARILATLTYELRRRNARYGLETMCIGGGQGIAAIFERM
ncbi:MAG: acetyl-CoA C-acetyltransferase [Acidimicrobiales bacterium]